MLHEVYHGSLAMDFTLYDPHVERWTSLAIGFSQMRLRVGGLQPLMVQRSFQPATSCSRNSTRTLPGYTDNGINNLFAHHGRHAASRIHRWHPQLCCKSYHSSVSVVLNPRYPIWLGPCYNTDSTRREGRHTMLLLCICIPKLLTGSVR